MADQETTSDMWTLGKVFEDDDTRYGPYQNAYAGDGKHVGELDPEHAQLIVAAVNGRGELLDERDRFKQWVDDLQSGSYITCVYCGHRYGPRETVPTSTADALKTHIETCPQHPMSAQHAHPERPPAAPAALPSEAERARCTDLSDSAGPTT